MHVRAPDRKGVERRSVNTFGVLNHTGQCNRNTAHAFALVCRFNERKDLYGDVFTDGWLTRLKESTDLNNEPLVVRWQ